MKIRIEMSPENYDGLLNKVSTESLAYSLLQTGIVESRPEGGNEDRVIDTLCEPTEAEILLGIANELWPKAASEIKDSIIRRALRKRRRGTAPRRLAPLAPRPRATTCKRGKNL